LRLDETPQRLEGMRQALIRTDGKDLTFLAHSLKGSSAQIGAVRVASLSAELEEKGAKTDFNNAADRASLGDLLAEIEREAIKRENDKDKLKELSAEIGNLSVTRDTLKAKWQKEKELVEKVQTAKAEIENLKLAAEKACEALGLG